MDKVGNFFVKVGQGIKKGFFGLINWIKNTAWIQPLLIVGVIFAVILGIKPFIGWVGGIFNPDESYEFYKANTIDDMTTIETNLISSDSGTVIVVFYGDDDTASKNIESTLRVYQSTHADSVKIYCVDIDYKDSDTVEQKKGQDKINDTFQNTYFDQYAESYSNMPVDMKNSSYSELTICDDDTTNVKIPSPLLARYDGTTLVGVKIDLSSSSQSDDFELFVRGDRTQWENGKL